jgi:hypothetical protein
LVPLRVSVQPPRSLNSAPDSVVGTAICRHGGIRGCGVTRVPSGLTRMCHWPIASTSSTPSGQADQRHLDGIDDRAAADADDQVGLGLAQPARQCDDGIARRVLDAFVEQADHAVLDGRDRVADGRGVAVQRTAGDHEDTARTPLRHLGGNAFGRAQAEVHPILREEVEDARSHVPVSFEGCASPPVSRR